MIRDNPKISVVIPVYNGAAYLAEAVESALAQTFSDYEIIIVDDGSTDQTAAIAHGFGDAVRYVYQKNGGLASARNTGIRHAQGELIALLDGDDAWLPQFLERMVILADAEPHASVFYSGVCYIDPSGRPLPQRGEVPVLSPEAFRRKMLRSNFLVPSAVVLRRAAVQEVGLFDVDYRRLQDWELWVRMLRRGHTFAGVADGLVRYRVHNESLSADPSGGERAALALALKHFGPDDEAYDSWEDDKCRVYGGVYRYVAVTASLVRRRDRARCAAYLQRALRADPTIATDLDIFYEIALGALPLGQRTVDSGSNMSSRIDHMQRLLVSLFPDDMDISSKVRRATCGTAYFALGLIGYHQQELAVARRCLLTALRYQPALLRNRQFFGTALRTSVGRSGIKLLRQAAHVRCSAV